MIKSHNRIILVATILAIFLSSTVLSSGGEEVKDISPSGYSLKIVKSKTGVDSVVFDQKPDIDTSSPTLLLNSYAVIADGRSLTQEIHTAMKMKVERIAAASLTQSESELFSPELIEKFEAARDKTDMLPEATRPAAGDSVEIDTPENEYCSTQFSPYEVAGALEEVDGKSWLAVKQAVSILQPDYDKMKVVETKRIDRYRFRIDQVDVGYRIAGAQKLEKKIWTTFLTPIARNSDLICKAEEYVKPDNMDLSSVRSIGNSFLGKLVPEYIVGTQKPYSSYYKEFGLLLKSMMTERFVKSQQEDYQAKRKLIPKRKPVEIYTITKVENGASRISFKKNKEIRKATITVKKLEDGWLIIGVGFISYSFNRNGVLEEDFNNVSDWLELVELVSELGEG